MSKTIALYGGSFDPPHVGHLMAASLVLSTQPVDEVWVMPAYKHPFGKKSLAFEHRVELVRRGIVEPLGGLLNGIGITEVEQTVGTGYTLDVVRHLKAAIPGYKFRVIFGTDILWTTHKWANWDALVREAPPIILNRYGHMPSNEMLPLGATLLTVPIPNVSSTEIRTMLNEPPQGEVGHKYLEGKDVTHLLHRSVLHYIRENNLYAPDPIASVA